MLDEVRILVFQTFNDFDLYMFLSRSFYRLWFNTGYCERYHFGLPQGGWGENHFYSEPKFYGLDETVPLA